jgi:hypothetical protein
VQIAKALLTKAKKSRQDPYLALLHYRNTPLPGLHASPAQLLMNCRTRTTLPTSEKLLAPKIVKGIPTKLKQKQETQKKYYDRGTKPLQPLKPGDSIRMKKRGTWLKGVVIKTRADAPQSYIVEVGGTRYIRNRQHLIHTQEQNPIHLDVSTDDTTNQIVHQTDKPEDESQNKLHPYRTRAERISKKPQRYHDSE